MLAGHCTHFLQSLDRTVFGPFKGCYDSACSAYLSENSLNAVNKWPFPGLFRQAFEAALTESNLKNGFKSCRIYPYNPACLPQHAMVPSVPTDKPLRNIPDVDRPKENEEGASQVTPPCNMCATAAAAATSSSDTDLEQVLSTSFNSISNDDNPLELLATTSLLTQITLDDPQKLFDMINAGVIDIIPDDAPSAGY